MSEFQATRGVLIAATVVGLLGGAVAGEAGWSLDPLARTPVCTAGGAQNFPILVAVEGFLFVVGWWDARRAPSLDVYAQKLTIDGEALFPVNGRVEVAFAACDGNLYIHRIGGNYVFDDGFELGDSSVWSAEVP